MALKLDDLDLGTVLLSPMAGVTDAVYRRLCRRMGADAVYTEFVSSDGIIRNNERTLEMLEFAEDERPIGIQIFGGDPQVVSDAARESWSLGPDLIDINFGCPARKVTKKMAGCAILQDLGLYREVIAAVVGVVDGPVTVKIRAGWDESQLVYLDATRIAAEEGARAVALHPRTRAQGYSGRADWDRITRLVLWTHAGLPQDRGAAAGAHAPRAPRTRPRARASLHQAEGGATGAAGDEAAREQLHQGALVRLEAATGHLHDRSHEAPA